MIKIWREKSSILRSWPNTVLPKFSKTKWQNSAVYFLDFWINFEPDCLDIASRNGTARAGPQFRGLLVLKRALAVVPALFSEVRVRMDGIEIYISAAVSVYCIGCTCYIFNQSSFFSCRLTVLSKFPFSFSCRHAVNWLWVLLLWVGGPSTQ